MTSGRSRPFFLFFPSLYCLVIIIRTYAFCLSGYFNQSSTLGISLFVCLFSFTSLHSRLSVTFHTLGLPVSLSPFHQPSLFISVYENGFRSFISRLRYSLIFALLFLQASSTDMKSHKHHKGQHFPLSLLFIRQWIIFLPFLCYLSPSFYPWA